ncbi:PREDICTED: ankyrin repeat domain-containing protein 10-like, partial [Priapulus caudatus]|uniref:Ankyrin repeat domain-containing protein 10-like n=1 Tax=Priapulus caudatus TaxID=37621 RepID=A0ABM1DU19_PRICU
MGIKSSMVAGSFLGSHPSNCLYRITPASYNHNWTDLHYAACQGNVHVLHRILFLEGIRDIDTKDYYGKSPLYWASYKGHLACMEDLIRFGADVDSVCCHGASPLHVAIGLYPDCSALLIKHGSNVDMADKWGVTPMYLAASNAQTHCIQLLLSAGAKPTYRNRKTGLVPRQLASTSSRPTGWRRNSKYQCTLCNVHVTSKEQLESHVNGARHKTKEHAADRGKGKAKWEQRSAEVKAENGGQSEEKARDST